MTQLLIIVCGNQDRGDDGAALLVAERLRALGMEVVTESGNALDLIHAWMGADEVILVDTVVSGAPPGTLHIWDSQRSLSFHYSCPASSHGLGVAEAIELARALRCLPRRLRVFGIEACEFGFGFQVAPELMPAVDRAVAKIRAIFKGARQKSHVSGETRSVCSSY
jgi:hydrogenase maturation protease